VVVPEIEQKKQYRSDAADDEEPDDNGVTKPRERPQHQEGASK
jgi:hypothetical protein